MKILEAEWYAVIKVYKLTIFERFFVLSYVLHVRAIPIYRVYRLYDTNILIQIKQQGVFQTFTFATQCSAISQSSSGETVYVIAR